MAASSHCQCSLAEDYQKYLQLNKSDLLIYLFTYFQQIRWGNCEVSQKKNVGKYLTLAGGILTGSKEVGTTIQLSILTNFMYT